MMVQMELVKLVTILVKIAQDQTKINVHHVAQPLKELLLLMFVNVIMVISIMEL